MIKIYITYAVPYLELVLNNLQYSLYLLVSYQRSIELLWVYHISFTNDVKL